MKKNLLTIAAIFLIAIVFGGLIFGQDINKIRRDIFLDDIAKYQADVENYINGKSKYLYDDYGDTDLIPVVISPKARAKYLKDKNVSELDPDGLLNAALDKLAATIDKPLRAYFPSADSFQFSAPADIKLIKSALPNLANLTIYKIGVYNASWYIVKNDFGLPVRRMKYGYVWAKDNSDDHPYCVSYQIELRQEYSGAGTYGDTYGWKDYDYRSRHFKGCPAGVATKPAVVPNTPPAENTDALIKQGNEFINAKNYAEAVKIFSNVIRINPTNEAGYFFRGTAYYESKQYQLAITDFTKAVGLSTKPDILVENLYNRALAYASNKNTDLALADSNKIISLNPNYWQAYFHRGNIYYDSNKISLALKDYTKTIELKPDFAKAYSYRADCYNKLGQADLAAKDRETAKSLEQ